MTTEYSISVSDWMDSSKWELIGHDIEMDWAYNHGKKRAIDNDEFDEDIGIPMMNYAYPLYSRPDDTTIRKIHRETNCTVVIDKDTDDCFLALTGGGMDLSQDIAYAYILTGERIPYELVVEVSKQPSLSMNGGKWIRIAKECERILRSEASTALYQSQEWKKARIEYQKLRKQKRH